MNEPELRPCPFCGDLQGCWHHALRAELEAAKAANKSADDEIMRMQAQVGGMATKLQYAELDERRDPPREVQHG